MSESPRKTDLNNKSGQVSKSIERRREPKSIEKRKERVDFDTASNYTMQTD